MECFEYENAQLPNIVFECFFEVWWMGETSDVNPASGPSDGFVLRHISIRLCDNNTLTETHGA